MRTEEGVFKGHKILTFKEDKRILLSIGLKKAALILEHIEAIKEFLAKNTESKETEPKNLPPAPQGNDIISNGI